MVGMLSAVVLLIACFSLLPIDTWAEEYPIVGNGDVNNDGTVTDADAVYLLRYTLFPEEYPLYPQKEEV